MSKFDPEFSPWKFTVQRSFSDESGLLRRRLKADRMLRIGSQSSNVYKKDLKSHFGCVNAIEFSNEGGKWIASGILLVVFDGAVLSKIFPKATAR